jgi:hypothetical protein
VSAAEGAGLDLRSLRTDRGWLDFLTDVPGAPAPGERVISYEEWTRAVRVAGEIGHAAAADAALLVLGDVRRAQLPRSTNALSPGRLERKEALR